MCYDDVVVSNYKSKTHELNKTQVNSFFLKTRVAGVRCPIWMTVPIAVIVRSRNICSKRITTLLTPSGGEGYYTLETVSYLLSILYSRER